jgi:hypothetical protein
MASSTSKIFWFAVLLFSLFSEVMAHEVRPALLQLTEMEGQKWAAVFKQPQVQSRYLNLKVITNCAAGDVESVLGGSALQESFVLTCSEALNFVEIEGLGRSLIDTMVTIEMLGGQKQSHLISSIGPTLELKGEGPAVPVFLLLGVEHLLFGVDHVLFILVLLYVVSGWVNLVKVITSFTLAHSITLGLAAFQIITIQQAPVEALIAFSIVLVAWESLRDSPGLIGHQPWLVAFMFGLLHGLGFAGALVDIGLPVESAIGALFLFNVGIEIGQLLIVALALGFVAVVQKSNIQLGVQARSLPLYFAGSIASFWFFDRTAQIFT